MKMNRAFSTMPLILVVIATALGIATIIGQVSYASFLLEQEKVTAALLVIPFVLFEILVVAALASFPIFGIVTSSIAIKHCKFRPFFVTSLLLNIAILIGAVISFFYFLSQVMPS